MGLHYGLYCYYGWKIQMNFNMMNYEEDEDEFYEELVESDIKLLEEGGLSHQRIGGYKPFLLIGFEIQKGLPIDKLLNKKNKFKETYKKFAHMHNIEYEDPDFFIEVSV